MSSAEIDHVERQVVKAGTTHTCSAVSSKSFVVIGAVLSVNSGKHDGGSWREASGKRLEREHCQKRRLIRML